MTGWENFFISELGASAALAGLVFVGISISLAKILIGRVWLRTAQDGLSRGGV